jgi:hypothetical protein
MKTTQKMVKPYLFIYLFDSQKFIHKIKKYLIFIINNLIKN